jgi:hypothetical protein
MLDYDISDTTLYQARKLGMYGEVRVILIKIAREAQPFAHPTATHRFGNLLLTIRDNVLVSIAKADQPFDSRPRRRRTARSST